MCVPGDTALLFTGETGFHALQELLMEQRGEVVNEIEERKNLILDITPESQNPVAMLHP